MRSGAKIIAPESREERKSRESEEAQNIIEINLNPQDLVQISGRGPLVKSEMSNRLKKAELKEAID